MSEKAAGPAAAGILGLLLLLGKSCDNAIPPPRVVVELPPTVGNGFDATKDIGSPPGTVRDTPNKVDPPPSGTGTALNQGPLRVSKNWAAHAPEPEEAGIAGGKVEGESIHTLRLGVRRWVLHDRPARAPKLLALFPQNVEEYTIVYGREANATAEAQIRTLNRKFDQAPDVERLESGMRLADALLRHDESAPLVVLAHSEGGGTILVLPNGERVDVADFHERCLAAGVPCIVLTCHGEDLGIGGELAPEDALAMWEAARRHDRATGLSVGQFALAMRQDQVLRQTRRRIFVSGAGIGSGGFVYAYVSTRDR